MGGNHSSLFWLTRPRTEFSAVQKQCRHLACLLPGKQTHPQSPGGPASAKATLVEPCLTSSAQKVGLYLMNSGHTSQALSTEPRPH